MSKLSDNINSRRAELGLTYEQVWQKLQEYPWPAGISPPSLPVVGHWFNGRRRPRKMEHLEGLVDVYGMTLDAASTGSPIEARTDEEQAWMEVFRELESGADREFMIATARQLARRPR